MSIKYITISEEHYAGADKIRVFDSKKLAENHVETQNASIDMSIVEKSVSDDNIALYLVLTEDRYGLDGVFTFSEMAEERAHCLMEKTGKDAFVLKLDI